MTKYIALMALLFAGTVLSGCAGDTRIGPSSDIALKVETSPTTSAHCVLANESGTWNLFTTPGYVDIHRSSSPLDVRCDNSRGWFGHVMVPANWEASGVVDAAIVGGLAVTAVAVVQPHIAVAALVGAGLGAASLTEGDAMLEDRAHTYPLKLVIPMYVVEADIPDAKVSPATTAPETAPADTGGQHKKKHAKHHVKHKKPDAANCKCITSGNETGAGSHSGGNKDLSAASASGSSTNTATPSK